MRDVSDWLRIPDFEPEVFRKNYQNLKQQEKDPKKQKKSFMP